MLKLLLALVVGQTLWANVPKSPIPQSRPANLSHDRIVEGELRNGVMKLSISLMDGLYYQKDNKEQVIPLMDYLVNEYPEVDFANLRFKKIMVVAQGASENASLSYMSNDHYEMRSYEVPRIADPYVAFGEYSQLTIENYEMFRPLAYLSVGGALWINNIIIEMEVGQPNFVFNSLPLEGRDVSNLAGITKPTFNEERFTKVYDTIMAENNYGNGIFNTNPMAGGFLQPISTTFNESIQFGSIRNNRGKLKITVTKGHADIKGFTVRFRNGSSRYVEMPYKFTGRRKTIEYIFKNGYSGAYVTLHFENATADARAVLSFR